MMFLAGSGATTDVGPFSVASEPFEYHLDYILSGDFEKRELPIAGALDRLGPLPS